ncbi:MAG TPA: hypothetical protein VGE07_01950 [Herpetosiphonaceae bacterium]
MNTEDPAGRPADGIDPLEIDDLPPAQRAIARLLLRRGELGEHTLRQLAAELDDQDFDAALAALQAGAIVLEGTGEPPLLRLNLRRKAPRRLSSNLWDALD